jgi:hypothetical protein
MGHKRAVVTITALISFTSLACDDVPSQSMGPAALGATVRVIFDGETALDLTDAPINTRLTFRVNDQNFCDENPTGAVTRNIIVNDVRLNQNATTPGTGDEPGFAFTVASDGTVSQ